MAFQFEQLETRQLLSASVIRKGDTLIITGDSDGDIVNLTGPTTPNGVDVGIVNVDLNGEMTSYSGIKSIKIKTGAGEDVVNVDGVHIAGNLSINSGAEDDNVSIDFGSMVEGKVNIKTGSGDDRLYFGYSEFVDLGNNLKVNLGKGDDILFALQVNVAGKSSFNGAAGTNTLVLGEFSTFATPAKVRNFIASGV
ncbi:MAG: hypothetical protein R3C01_08105 [Planctomycetaceae bacterium]